MSRVGLVKAAPLLPVLDDSLPQKFEAARERVASLLRQALQQEGVEAEMTWSNPYAPETYVLVRGWLPQGGDRLTLRGNIEVKLRHAPSRRYWIVSDITVTVGHLKRSIYGVIEFDERIARTAARLLTGRQRMAIDWLVHLLIPHGLINPHRHFWSTLGAATVRALPLLSALILSAVVLLVRPDAVCIVAFFPLIGIFLTIRIGARRLTETTGQAHHRPRVPLRLDSWHTVLIGLGPRASDFRDRLIREFRDGLHTEVTISNEDVTYLMLNEAMARRQIVLQFRRAICFVEIHAYGDDLYFDWEAYLNLGVWSERVVGTYLRSDLRFVDITEAVVGVEPINEYDLSDGSFLLEWTHAAAAKVIRRLLAELEIDQEIDFRIRLRSDRREVLSEARSRARKGIRRLE